MPPKKTNQTKQSIRHIWHAFRYSMAGLKAACTETSFRQEIMAMVVLVPTALWLANDPIEAALLITSMLLVLIVELLNSAIESVVDRFGSEWNAQSKRAKDMGSAAVMLSLVLSTITWIGVIWHHWVKP